MHRLGRDRGGVAKSRKCAKERWIQAPPNIAVRNHVNISSWRSRYGAFNVRPNVSLNICAYLFFFFLFFSFFFIRNTYPSRGRENFPSRQRRRNAGRARVTALFAFKSTRKAKGRLKTRASTADITARYIFTPRARTEPDRTDERIEPQKNYSRPRR